MSYHGSLTNSQKRQVYHCTGVHDMCKVRWFGDLERESDRAERLARRQGAREEQKNATEQTTGQ